MPADISLNDMDGDGDLDVVLAGMGGNQIIWYENKLNDNTTTTTTPVTTTTIPVSTTTTVPVATIIKLSSFAAIPKSDTIILEWSTESEIDNMGFNLYRSETENGQYTTKINASLISAQGSALQGASYEFVDKDVKNRKTYWYKLEDVDVNGTSTMHGPISATPRWIWGIF